MEKEDYTENIFTKMLQRDKLQMTIEEKGFALKQLKNEYGLSNRKLGELIGEPHSTIHDWISGRQQRKTNTPGNLHISLTRIKEHLEKYEPKDKNEINKIKSINSMLSKKYVNVKPKPRYNTHLSLSTIKHHLEQYEPKSLFDWEHLIGISKIVNEKLKSSPIATINKNIGWVENEEE